MNLKNCSMVLLCATLFITSCSKDGSNGVDGTNGTNGTNGTIGTNGTNGANGKTALTRTSKEAAGANCKYGGTKFETGIDANNNGTLEDNEVTTTQTKYVCDGAVATYSSWIDVNLVDTTFEEMGIRVNRLQIIPLKGSTAEIVNNGIVLMYYKNKNGQVHTVEREHTIVDMTADGQTDFWFSPGFVLKEKNIHFLVFTYYEKEFMNDNGSAVRYVLIPGNAQGRSIADLKKMPYNEVAKLFNIKD